LGLLSFQGRFSNCFSDRQEAHEGVPDFHQSVAEADANLSGCFDHLIAWIDISEVVDGVGDWYIEDLIVFVAHHCAEFPLGDQLNSFDTKTSSQKPVDGRRGSAPLKVS
jgi:hypothetical protein